MLFRKENERISMFITTCKRCDKQITIGSRLLYGLDSLKIRISI